MKPKLLLLTLLLSLTLAACTPARSEPESGSDASAPSSQAEEQPSEPSSSGSESHSEPAAPEESSTPDWAAEGFAPANCVPAVRACGATIVADADHDTLADIVSRLDKMYA